MTTPIKEATGWAVVNPGGWMIPATIGPSSGSAVAKYLGKVPITNHEWALLQSQGYRCIRVRLVPVEGAA